MVYLIIIIVIRVVLVVVEVHVEVLHVQLFTVKGRQEEPRREGL